MNGGASGPIRKSNYAGAGILNSMSDRGPAAAGVGFTRRR
jgi:hypothetical protein